MAEAVEDLGDWNLKAIGNQTNTLGRRSSLARPDIDPDVVMVTPGGEEQGARVGALRDRETQKLAIKPLRRRKVGNVQVDMPDVGLRQWFGDRGFVRDRGEQRIEIQSPGHHRNLAVAPGPLGSRQIRIKFNAIAVRITEIDRFADAMIGGSGYRIAADRPGADMPGPRPRRPE